MPSAAAGLDDSISPFWFHSRRSPHPSASHFTRQIINLSHNNKFKRPLLSLDKLPSLAGKMCQPARVFLHKCNAGENLIATRNTRAATRIDGLFPPRRSGVALKEWFRHFMNQSVLFLRCGKYFDEILALKN